MCDASGVVEETVSGLDKYLKADDERKESKTALDTVKDPKESLVFTPDMPTELRGGYFTSIGYDGDKHAAYIKLYDAKTQRVHFWYDDTGHKPYCLSDQPVEKLQQNDAIVKNPGFDGFATVSKHDGLNETEANMTMIIAKDPLSIGGRATGSIRDIVRAWEADIKYVENYIYDKDLKPGMPYDIREGKLSPTPIKISDEASSSISKFFEGESADYKELALEWTNLLEYPVPDIRKAALDIEVYSPVATRIPDPGTAEHPVICASVLGSDGVRRVLLLRRTDVAEGNTSSLNNIKIEYYDSEENLLTELFKVMLDYPIILTFNGDDFDLTYLWHRAQRLGFTREQIPIEIGRDSALLRYGMHIDLYRFFFNRSVQVYAFGQKYRENTLNEVGSALVNMEKKQLDAALTELTYAELAEYCFRDSEIVMQLASFDDNLVMKLILALSRISFMSMEDVSRQGVSSWIRSMMYREHRKRRYLIPRADDILSLKGATATQAVIKGKKYKGAIVIEPIPGVHFGVSVLDFMSMYPSVIKKWNLGYETILCKHQECRRNIVPDTPHWVCTKRRSIESIMIGSLRDLRVKWYKSKSRDKSLPPAVRSWYKVISDALKVVLNASYGVFGNESFALYCPPVAEATAAIGRHAITQTIEKAKSLGLEVFYGDTDSIFLGAPSQEKLQNLIEWSTSHLGMELEVDKSYRYLALSSRKKNYLGVYPDGSVDIKGLTGKKRHVPEFLKHAFYEMIDALSQVQSPAEFEAVREKIKNIVKTCYLRLRNREYSLQDLAFTIMISRSPEGYTKTTPQHVKAARLLKAKGIDIRPGDLIAFVKTRGEPGVKPVQLNPSWQEIDIEKYVEYLESTFDQVLDSVGLDFAELAGGTKLESFFQAKA
jgi:DNA polymerase I